MRYEILPPPNALITFLLEEGERIHVAKNQIAWMTEGLCKKKELLAVSDKLRRKEFLSADPVDSLQYVTYAPDTVESLALAGSQSGEIFTEDVSGTQEWIFPATAFLAADSEVEFEIHSRTSLGKGRIFSLYQAYGDGKVFLKSNGMKRVFLLEEGQVLFVQPGHFLAAEQTLDLHLERNIFSTENTCLRASGPGKLLLQTSKSDSASVPAKKRKREKRGILF